MSEIKEILLLRGLLREQGHWGNFPDKIQSAFPAAKVVCVDLPGTGENSSKIPPWSVFGNAEFVHREIQKKAPSDSIGVIGVSLGGMVAMELVGQFPKFYKKAVVVNSSCRLSPKTKRLRWQIWKNFLKVIFETHRVKREELLIPQVINSAEGREAALQQWGKLAKDLKFHPLTPVAQLKAAQGFLPAEKLKGSKDILLLSALGDLFVDPSCSELLHRRYDWPMKTHPWGGHDLSWDDPQWMLKEIEAFFS